MIFSALLLLAAAAPGDTDPMAPALAGQMRCETPDAQAKTCKAIIAYTKQADGSWIAHSKRLLPFGDLTMETNASVTLSDGALCGTISHDDMMAAKLSTPDGPMAPEAASPILEQISGFVAAYYGKRVCSRLVQDGAGLKSEVTVDGAAAPQLTQQVIWIGKDDGYTLVA